MKIRRGQKLLFTTVIAFVLTLGTTEMTAQGDQLAKNNVAPAGGSATADSAAPSAVSSAASSSSITTRVGIATAQPISLSLDEAIRKALANNNTIELTRDDVRFQETEIRRILGFYDPTFNATPTYRRNSTTGSSATRDFTVNSDVTHFIQPGGGSYQAFFNNTRSENAFTQAQVTSGSPIAAGLSAIYSSSLGARYTQPLFRNFKIDAVRRNLKVAKRRLEQTDADFRRQTIEVIAQVQRTYWDLVFALRDQQNRVANLDLTRENLRQVEARIAAGAAAPIARAEVATELANREGEVLLATEQVSKTENALKQLLLRDATNAEWTSSYVPTDRPAISLDAV